MSKLDADRQIHISMPAIHRRQVLGLGVGAIAATAGFGAQGQSGNKPVPPPPAKPTRQIVVGLYQEPTAFNPLMPGIEVDETVWMQIFNTMWVADPKGNLIPDLAVEVPSEANGGISDGGLAWKVKLREGVTWHDGTPFTAEDVKYTLELINAPGFKARTRIGHALVRDIVVKGNEISWRMEKAYSPYLALLSNTYIVPKHILGKASDPNTAPFNGAPVGTGPFKWDKRTPGDNISLVANEKFHGKGPYLERAILKYIPDKTALYAQFRTGQIDITIGGFPENYYQEATKLQGRKVQLVPNASLEIVMPNLEHPALQEKAVRQALYASINKQAIIDAIYYGLHKPTESFAPQESWAYDPSLPKQEYSIAKANKLLDDAGWKRSGSGPRMKNGVPLEFAMSTTTGAALREQCQQLMQQDWKQIGANVKINNMPAAVIWGEFYTRSKFESLIVGTVFRTVIDPDPAHRFASDAIPAKTGAGANQMQWQNAEADKLLKAGQETFDQAKRKDIYRKLQELVREELPILPIFQYVVAEGHKEGLIGYEPNINARQNTWNMGSWYWAR
jgi:peptide/nickel transport system substrate-binding protein